MPFGIQKRVVRPTSWDLRAFLRAVVAACVALAVVWLVTAASDEGQLSAAVRLERSLPLAPLCSAVAAALALGTAKVREETRALEAVGRAPFASAVWAIFGAALPSLLVAAIVASCTRVDVGAFYPTPAKLDTWRREAHSFSSPSLGVRIEDETGEPYAVPREPTTDASLPIGARASAALTTALAGVALAAVASRVAQRASLVSERRLRRRRWGSIAAVALVAILTVIGFQAAAARSVPTLATILPPLALLVFAAFGYRSDHGHSRGRPGDLVDPGARRSG